MPAKRSVFPVFLPHAGCPFQCVYCNQHAVASARPLSPDAAGHALSSMGTYAVHVRDGGRPGEIAFFGGTFTALDLRSLVSILDSAALWVAKGVFTGIRFSTRPDCLGSDILAMLRDYPVRTVELGAQSLRDEVLHASRRGYRAHVVCEAAAKVRQMGWELGIQLMAGLPGDRPELFTHSVRSALGLMPGFLRFYPTLVLAGTALAESFRSGSYTALGLEEAVSWVLPGYDLALRAGVPVVRMGLHADPALEAPGTVLAGPYHASFGHLVRCRWWRDRIDGELARLANTAGENLVLRVAAHHVGDIAGPGRSNVAHWKDKWEIESLKIYGDEGLTGLETVLERQR